MNILIVDDDEIDIALIKNALDSALNANHQIDVADSVSKGIELIESKTFDVILLDYHLPEINGMEMIIDIRSRPHLGNTAIIVISAAQNHELELECIEAGAQDFISKTEVTYPRLNKAILHSKKRFELEQKMQASYLAIKNMAETDQLTGLYNRYYFNENLRFMTESCKRSGLSVGMLALDIDNFKHVNDSLGHQAGDQLLVAVVDRIKQCLRANDGFSRIGGDEFAITLPEIHLVDEIHTIATRILNSASKPFVIDGKKVNCSLSIGAALYPNDAKNQEELVKCADIAMYRAKQQGKNTIRYYESHYQQEFNRQYVIQNTISEILKQSKFRLFYQPIFHAHNDNIKGVEALIRWPDTQPFYSPDEFIPIAEESRIINKIGHWVMATSFQQLAIWQQSYAKDLKLSINISAIQLQDTDFVSLLVNMAKTHSLRTEYIILEITETALLSNNDDVLTILNELSAHGFKIALDDFGMGYSSISHLHSYPIDIVKIDKSLQETNQHSGKKKGVLEAVALMLKLLDFIVVAEGIETEQQLKVCHKLKVDRIQGYLLGKPLPAEEITRLLKEQN